MQTIRRTPLVLVAAGALALSACSSDEVDTPEPTETATPTGTDTDTPAETGPETETTGPTATPTPTSTAAGVPALSEPCELSPDEAAGIESVTFAVPEGWKVEDASCEFLDPSADDLESGTEPDTALALRIGPVDFATAASAEGIDQEGRWTGARSGYPAVRIQGETTGEGLRPAGEPVHQWLVDLGTGTDEQGATLIMSARPSAGADAALAAEALDRIAQTVLVTPNATDSTPIVATRVEGGGTPHAVTYDEMEGCFLLHAGGPSDEVLDDACEVELDGAEIAGAVLSDGDREVVAGFAPAQAVIVESDAADAPTGSITTAVEGASLFAHHADGTPVEVRAVDAAGDTLATASIGWRTVTRGGARPGAATASPRAPPCGGPPRRGCPGRW